MDWNKIHELRAIVVGDVMLDQYWYGDVKRISPEAPVPIIHVHEEELRLGGAANVAANMAALGCHVRLLSLVGNDTDGLKLKALLDEYEIKDSICIVPGMSTTKKLRLIARAQPLLRADFETPFVDADNLLSQLFSQVIETADLVVFSDYNKGVLQPVQRWIQEARRLGKTVLVDPKSADPMVYRGANIVTPNLKEFEQWVGACANTEILVAKAVHLIAQMDIEALLVTQGEAGMTLIQADGTFIQVPACVREVFNVTGAGDSVIATLACCIGAKASYSESVQLANLSGGLAVGRVGTAVISQEELKQVQQNAKHSGGLKKPHSLTQLVEICSDLKKRKKRIVFTNGCFDILHAGHVDILERCRAMGDCLIIGLNSDQSIQRLKGAHRPINPLEQRATVLLGLSSVDYVVAFEDDTPLHLIQTLTPDILIKGGDYTIDTIVGAEWVQEHGGHVYALPFQIINSTSTIEKKLATLDMEPS
ncbi:MAG: bifunctional D-glycero-beta-D-manno-heptose-7-phosphate kinase/D-glycero-beta-D-manno-heptose 1-phosphate adenylyltransferase HldE [Pseudomonadota bacterium]